MGTGHRKLLVGLLVGCAAAACGDDRNELEQGALSAPPPQDKSAPSPAGDNGSPQSSATTAYTYFASSVYPALGACIGCHSAGLDGAPIFFGADAKVSYDTLDASGMILTTSPILTKGPHANGGPALGTAESYVKKWLELEAAERVGQESRESVLAGVAACMDKELFAKINLCSATTRPRIGESGNNCTGCKYQACSTCHQDGGQSTGFWCSDNVDETLTGSKQMPFLRRYFGLSGSTPVASNAILNKSTTTKTTTHLSAHPWFVIDAVRQQALDKFVTNAIDRYKQGGCAQ